MPVQGDHVEVEQVVGEDSVGLHAQELRPVRSGPGTAGVVVLAVVCAQLGMNVSWCLVVLMLAPVVTVLGYETVGHRHLAEALARDRQL